MSEQNDIALLKKRARAKFFTNSYLYRLIDLDSNMKKSYKYSTSCATVLTQKDKTLTGKYCNQRWCTVCNRIRIARFIEGYGAELKEFVRPYFLTLTVPNCEKSALKRTVEQMDKNFTKLVDVLKKRKIKLKGIRKLEITYNPDKDTYHPHFHLIVDEFEGMFERSYPADKVLNRLEYFILCQIGFLKFSPAYYYTEYFYYIRLRTHSTFSLSSSTSNISINISINTDKLSAF